MEENTIQQIVATTLRDQPSQVVLDWDTPSTCTMYDSLSSVTHRLQDQDGCKVVQGLIRGGYKVQYYSMYRMQLSR